MVFFEDKNHDGLIVTELQTNDPDSLEVKQRLWYYPFRMQMEGVGQSLATPVQPYRYNGKELDEATGLYDYGARYYDPTIARFTSTDPLAYDFAMWSTYTYVLDNPVKFIDRDGRKPTVWKDKEGNTLSKEDRTEVKVYIFYDATPNGKDGGFPEQTMAMYEAYEEAFGEGSVALSSARTTEDFAQDWGDISGTPERIVINMHGSDQALHLDTDPDGDPTSSDGEYLVSTDNGETNRSETPGLKVSGLPKTSGDISSALLCLNTCNSANPSGSFKPGLLLAAAFSTTGVGQVRASTTKVSFQRTGYRWAVPADGDWNPFNNSESTWTYYKDGKEYK